MARDKSPSWNARVYSVVTDLALDEDQPRLQRSTDSDLQIPREVDVEPVQDGKVIAQQLERDDVEDPLETVHG